MRISPHVHLETMNNKLSDLMAHTLLEPGSAVFDQLLKMKAGDDIIFSGSFVPSDDDCVQELSLTQQGSMTDPEFVFRFTGVQPGPNS